MFSIFRGGVFSILTPKLSPTLNTKKGIVKVIQSRLFTFHYPAPSLSSRIILIGFSLVIYSTMARKIRVQRNLAKSSRKDLKRKRQEVNEEIDDTIQLDDDVDESRSESITDGVAVQPHTFKVSLSFL